MSKIQLANGQTVKAIRVWDGVKWIDRIGRVYTDKWSDFISYYEKYVFTGLGWGINYFLEIVQFSYDGAEKNRYNFKIYETCNTLETDPNGNVYYGHTKGYAIFDKSFTIIRSSNYYVTDIAVNKNGDYAFISNYGAYDNVALLFMSKNGETKKIVGIPKRNPYMVNRGMCYDNEGNIYTHINPGELTKFDAAGNELLSFQVPTASYGYSYGSIDIDNDGNLYRLKDETIEKYDKTGKLIKNVKLSDKRDVRGRLYVDRDFVFVAIANYFSSTTGTDRETEDSLIKLTKNLEVVKRINGERFKTGMDPSFGDSIYCDREDGVYTVGVGKVRKNSKNDLSLIWEKDLNIGSLNGGKCACTPGRFGAFGEV
ncbi:hypothetical protein C4A76_15040 [Brevibacillus laterosporus]|uniref:hypothetical protein n=1 Tax=Brevibacillus laterosporus TaxID=1465 RepID=UPI000CE47855|nr:hypothetical protein [Brevibacillus laterosporus]PPA85955.1 hypothetical protein C4A76_15040 [Brevibacillus laterosporus]